jgi:hypothetical protein
MSKFNPVNGSNASAGAVQPATEEARILQLEKDERDTLRVICPSYLPLLKDEWMDKDWERNDELMNQQGKKKDGEGAEDDESVEEIEKMELDDDDADEAHRCQWAQCDMVMNTAKDLFVSGTSPLLYPKVPDLTLFGRTMFLMIISAKPQAEKNHPHASG